MELSPPELIDKIGYGTVFGNEFIDIPDSLLNFIVGIVVGQRDRRGLLAFEDQEKNFRNLVYIGFVDLKHVIYPLMPRNGKLAFSAICTFSGFPPARE
jgi:hypothetical protein